MTAPPEVTPTVTDSLLQAPDTLSEGWTTFRLVNEGDEPERLEIYTYGDNHWDGAYDGFALDGAARRR